MILINILKNVHRGGTYMRYLSDDGKYLIQIAPVMSMSNGSKKKKRMK